MDGHRCLGCQSKIEDSEEVPVAGLMRWRHRENEQCSRALRLELHWWDRRGADPLAFVDDLPAGGDV